jgi:cell division protein FtsL
MGLAKRSPVTFDEKVGSLLQQYGRGLLSLFVVVLLVHNVFGAHGFLAMRRTQDEIEKVKKELNRLNSENQQLQDDVKSLKTDPRRIEKIARDELLLAKPGEIIINSPQPQAPLRNSSVNP